VKAPAWLATRLADHVYRLRWFCGRLPDPISVGASAWRVVTPTEAEAWVRAQRVSPADREMYRLALESQHALLVTEDGGRVVGHRWVGGGWTYLPEPIWCRVRFPDGLAYCYDLHVERSHRGRGLSHGAIAGALGVARSRGCSACACYVARTNLPSLSNWKNLAVGWFDATRVTARRRGLWLPRPPWSRVGVEQVEWWTP
jgi:GNAT superfamily N-acetyltransferase